MIKLEELINELCPNGVVFKKVGDICETITDYTSAGSFADIAKNVSYINNEIGYAQLVRTTDLKNKFTNSDKFIYVDEHAFKYLWRVNLNSEGLVLPNVGNCGEVYYVTPQILPNEKNVLGPNAIWIRSNSVDIRFLYHVFLTTDFQAKLSKIISPTGQTKFNKTNFKELKIPVPPISVQHEIVHILDTFTSLSAELSAELSARKKQYEYYRDKLLSYPVGVKYYKLCDIGKFYGGLSGKTKDDFADGNCKYITYMNVYNNIAVDFSITEKVKIIANEHQNCLKYGDIIFTGSSETQDECGYSSVVTEKLEEDIYLNSFCFFLRLNDINLLNPNFAKYLFRSNFIRKQIINTASGVTRFNVSKKKMENIVLGIPSMDIQQRIIKILDKFDMICSDLNIGLPAEIEARKKQYEFYRDQLLTFVQTGHSILTDRQTDRI